ncbi:MAG: anti-sigma factor family protein [Novosphingobium sp.]
MTVTPEDLARYADGECDEVSAARIARAVAQDPALAAQLEQLQSLRSLLAARFDPVLAEPVPDRITRPLHDAAKVVDLSAVREARSRWFERPAIRYVAGPAIAAALVIAVMVGRSGTGIAEGYADSQLAAALDGTLTGEVAAGGTRPLLSFRDQAGQACRAWAGQTGGGIACRDAKGWKIRTTGQATGGSGTAYQQAGSGDAAIMAAAQNLASGPAMDRAAEEAARQSGWTRQN